MKSLLQSLKVAGFTIVVRAIGAAKEIVVAGLFGTSDALDAFLGASVLPVLAINVLVSTLGVALIPRIAKLEAERGAETAQMLASKVLVGLTGFLVGLATVLELTAPVLIPLLYPGFDAAKQATTVSAFRILALTIPLSGVAAVWGGLLTLKRRYSIVALAPMMTPLLTLALVLSQGAKSGIIPLALGAFSGSLLETLLLGAAVKRTGYPVLPRWIPHADAEVRPVLKQYAAIAVAALFSSSSLLVDQTMVSSLGPGNLSALSYGSKISGMILSVLSTGLAMVLLPRFSEFAARRNWRELRIHHSTICRQVTMASIAAAIVLAFFSPAIIQFLFERGAFKTSDTLAVSRIQSMYAFQMPFFLVGVVTARLLSALSANQVLIWIGALNMVLNIAGNFVLRAYLGAPGIALSSSVVQIVSCVLLIIASSRILRRCELSMLSIQESRAG